MQRLDPPSWGIGATLPSFAVSFVLAVSCRSPTGSREPARLRPHTGLRECRTSPSSATSRVDRVDGGPPAARRLPLLRGACAARDRRPGHDPHPLRCRPTAAVRRAGPRARRARDDPPRRADGRLRPHYEGEHRSTTVTELGDPWTAEDAAHLAPDVTLVHVAPLLRCDFPPQALAASRPEGARCPSTRRGSSARGSSARSSRTPTSTPRCSRTVTVLKLYEEEARIVAGGRSTRRLPRARCRRDPRHARLARRGRVGRGPRDPRPDDAGPRRARRPAPATRSWSRTSPRAHDGATPVEAAAGRQRARRRDADRAQARLVIAGAARSPRRRSGSRRSTSTTDELVRSSPATRSRAARRRACRSRARRGRRVRRADRRRRRPAAAARRLGRRRRDVARGRRRAAARARRRDLAASTPISSSSRPRRASTSPRTAAASGASLAPELEGIVAVAWERQ